MSATKDQEDILSTETIKASITYDNVKSILSDHYGLKVIKIKDLDGYDDINHFVQVEKSINNDYIDTICEDGYIFKVINSYDSKMIEFFHAQDSVLLFLGDRAICCPRPVRMKDGKFLMLKKLTSGNHILRLLQFIPSEILVNVECSVMLCYQCGSYVANLNQILKNFSHKGYENRNTPWMMEKVPKLLEFLFAVNDNKKRQLVSEVVEAFKSRVLKKSDQFEKGLIHGDFNEHNILVERRNGDWHVKGVLDFGDSHITCFLYEIAITMTYIMIHSKNLDSGGYVLAGYNSVRPLSSEEIQLLKARKDLQNMNILLGSEIPMYVYRYEESHVYRNEVRFTYDCVQVCVCARMCQSLVLGAFTYSRDPENTYVLGTSKFGWEMLEKLWNIPEETIIERWTNITNNFSPKTIHEYK